MIEEFPLLLSSPTLVGDAGKFDDREGPPGAAAGTSRRYLNVDELAQAGVVYRGAVARVDHSLVTMRNLLADNSFWRCCKTPPETEGVFYD